MSSTRRLAVGLIPLVLAGWVQGQIILKDLPYVPGGSPLQKLDLYLPEVSPPAPLPVMMYVHGGAWQAGDKSHVGYKDDAFLSDGYIFVSVNYRLAPEVTWREMAGDIASAIAWVRQHIAEYGGDPSRIFLMGHSAGAHLVTLVATDETYLEQVGLSLGAIAAVVSLDTRAYDLVAFAKLAQGLPPLYQTVFGQDPEEWRAASPITYVTLGKPIPPMAVVWSRGPYRAKLSGRFVEALELVGNAVLPVDASFRTHRSLNRLFGAPGDPVAQTILPWLRQFRP